MPEYTLLLREFGNASGGPTADAFLMRYLMLDAGGRKGAIIVLGDPVTYLGVRGQEAIHCPLRTEICPLVAQRLSRFCRFCRHVCDARPPESVTGGPDRTGIP
jgi:hypothetical protein